MTQLQVQDGIVRPAIADSLGIEKERDVWLPCTLQELDPYEELEWLDLLDIAWRLKRLCLEFGFKITVKAGELENQPPKKPVTVADVVTLIRRKLDEAKVPVPMVVSKAM